MASIVICAVTTVFVALASPILSARGWRVPATEVPLLASSVLAWGGGFLLAFSASVRALRRDWTDGICSLYVTRTASLRGYLIGRVGGLAALLAIVVAGGTFVCGFVTALCSPRITVALRVLHATGAAVVFGVAFSIVMAAVAFAALGARSRASGYLLLLSIVVLPELVVSRLPAIPESLADVLSIPSALGALRSSLAPDTLDFLQAGRAFLFLAIVSVCATLLVRHEAVTITNEKSER